VNRQLEVPIWNIKFKGKIALLKTSLPMMRRPTAEGTGGCFENGSGEAILKCHCSLESRGENSE
jgi:hypothetical protein